MGFLGSFENSFDAKGRVMLPAKYRKSLNSDGTDAKDVKPSIELVVTLSFDNELRVYTSEQFDTYLVCLLRLIVIPAIMIPITLLFRQSCPQLALSVSMLAAVTPVASAVQMAAQLYEGDDRCAALMFAISTLICIITIPLMLTLYFQF